MIVVSSTCCSSAFNIYRDFACSIYLISAFQYPPYYPFVFSNYRTLSFFSTYRISAFLYLPYPYHSPRDVMWEMEDWRGHIPLGIVLVSMGQSGERLLFMHPYENVTTNTIPEAPQRASNYSERVKSGSSNSVPMPVTVAVDQSQSNTTELSFPTQFGLSTGMLSNILSVKAASCDQPFEMKVDNIRFAGHPKSVTDPGDCQSSIFSIVFVLPANVDPHIVEAFQQLSKKLALAIDALQTLNKYFSEQERDMRRVLEEYDTLAESDHPKNPWMKVARESRLALMLSKVFDDVGRTGRVQVFVDDFIEVGFCVQSLALVHAHLTPKNRSEIDRLVKMIRPYHGILLLEDVWPTPDGNPSVALLLKHSSPDRSILDISISSGIPLLQVFLIVRHLLTWVRAVVVYPLCDSNVYTSATRPKALGRQMERFAHRFGTTLQLAAALAHFNPPATLESFVRKEMLLVDQQVRTNVVVFLLRHQLIMQLHKFCYVMAPLSDAELPRAGKHCPDTLKLKINGSDLTEDVRTIVSDMCGQMLETESYCKVSCRLELFLRMVPYMKGMHHVEDIIYRLNECRIVVEEVLSSFSLVISSFLRPDFITE